MSLFLTVPDWVVIIIVCLEGKTKMKNLILKNLYNERVANSIVKLSDKMIILVQRVLNWNIP